MAQAPQSPNVIRFGVFEANLRSAELRKYGTRIKLQERPFQILALLLREPNRVVTREELRTELWPANTFVDFEHGISSAVSKLREALCDSVDAPRFIETVGRRTKTMNGWRPWTRCNPETMHNRSCGHKNPKNDDNGSRVIGQTRQYILDFQELAGKTTTAKELYDQMLVRYPEWLNRGALWSSVTTIKK